MARLLKILVSGFTALVVFFFITTMLSVFTALSDAISATLSLPFALFAGWTAWNSAAGKKIGAGFAVLSGGLIFGGLGFSIGFLGPLLFVPGANQGPLLGIFITGPLGIVAGTIIGYIYWSRKLKHKDAAGLK